MTWFSIRFRSKRNWVCVTASFRLRTNPHWSDVLSTSACGELSWWHDVMVAPVWPMAKSNDNTLIQMRPASANQRASYVKLTNERPGQWPGGSCNDNICQGDDTTELGATDSRQVSVPGDNATLRSVGLIIFISVSIPWIFHKQRYGNFLICPRALSPINNLKVSRVTQWQWMFFKFSQKWLVM